MWKGVLAVVVLLAGCTAPAPATPASATTSAATTSQGPTAPPVPPPPPPRVGTCDLVLNSAGTSGVSARYPSCLVADAFPDGLQGAGSLLVEVTWAQLQPTILGLHSHLQVAHATDTTPNPELASNNSMVPPVRVALEGDALTKNLDGLTALVTVTSGAAAQQQFHLTMSLFPQARVPANYTAIH